MSKNHKEKQKTGVRRGQRVKSDQPATGLTPEETAECQRLRAIWESRRRELRLTQETMAARLNMSQSNFSHFLLGRQKLNAELIIKAAEELQFKPGRVRREMASLDGSFYDRDAPAAPGAIAVAPPQRRLTPDDESLIDEFNKLFSSDQRIVRGLIKSLPKKEES